MKHFFSLAACVVTVLFPGAAWAVNITCYGTPISALMASNRQTDTAHPIYVNENCDGGNLMCQYGRAYIEFEDTAVFAQALTAKAQNRNINLRIQIDAAAKGTNNSFTTCKVLAIWY
jgi:hypothetical protein